MTSPPSRFEPAFLARQRQLLVGLRNDIRGTQQDQTLEEIAATREAVGQAREYEDDAQRLTTLELQGQLSVAGAARLERIERALQKLDEGTYGLSDASGQPIELDRLQTSPEALFTLEEQRQRDQDVAIS
jgi:DnaK suppressor protein